MSIERLTQATNELSEVPARVIIGLTGTDVCLMTDPHLDPKTAAVDLRPPEAFTATYVPTVRNLLIGNAPDRTGGMVMVRIGPEAAVEYGEVSTTDAEVAAMGTFNSALCFGDLSLRTTGEGTMAVEFTMVNGNLRTDAARPEFVRIGLGVVVAGQIIESP